VPNYHAVVISVISAIGVGPFATLVLLVSFLAKWLALQCSKLNEVITVACRSHGSIVFSGVISLSAR